MLDLILKNSELLFGAERGMAVFFSGHISTLWMEFGVRGMVQNLFKLHLRANSAVKRNNKVFSYNSGSTVLAGVRPRSPPKSD